MVTENIMKDMKFKRIVILFVVSIIIGCIYLYFDARLVFDLRENFKGITMTATSDELKYLGRINTFYKGNNFTLSGFENYEHQGQPWTFGFLPEVILGCLGRLSGISVIKLDILMTFLLPAVLFVLIYNLTLRLSNSATLSFLSSSSVLLGYHVFTKTPAIFKNIINATYAEPLWFLRPVSPSFNHIVLILTLLLLYKALASRQTLTLWVSGLLLGSLFYIFIHHWTFIYAGLFVLAFIFLLKKDFDKVRKIAFIILLSLIISIPHWINFWKLIHFPHYDTLEYLNGVIYSHKPIVPISHILLTLFILLSYYRKKLDFSFWFIVAFIMGGFICVNQQIISGKTIQYSHWMGYANKTFLIISFFACLKNFKELFLIKEMINKTFFRRFLICLFLGFLISVAFNQQRNFYNLYKNFYFKKQSLAPVFTWLKEHAKKDEVILTDPFNIMKEDSPLPDDILVYTDNFSFLPVSAGTIRSRDELENRYLIGLILLGYSLDEAKDFFKYSNGVFFLCMAASEEYGGEGMRPEYFGHLKEKFLSFTDRDELFSRLKKYRLDYILVNNDRVTDTGILQKYSNNLLKVYDDRRFTIFKFETS